MYTHVRSLLLFHSGGQSAGALCANEKARECTAHANLHMAPLQPNA